MKPVKTIGARLKEVIEFRTKFEELGMDCAHESMKELVDTMNAFVRDGIGFSDRILLPDYDRVAIC